MKQLEDKQSEARAVEGESKRLKQHRSTDIERSDETRRATRGKRSGAKQKEKDQAKLAKQARLLAASSPTRNGTDDNSRSAIFPKFGALPGNVQDIIFGMLLTNPDPIKLNTARLKAFVDKKTNVPPTKTTSVQGTSKKSELKSPHVLRIQLEEMKADIRNIPRDQWPCSSVVSGLTLSLLKVSSKVHQQAVSSFYSNNIFEFSNPRDAWLHLESFLLTIGQRNARKIQHLSVAIPKWYPDTSGDRVACALLEAFSPITRLSTCTDVEEDRLLSAISTCTSMLTTQGSLKSLQFDMPFSRVQSFIDDRHVNSTYVLSAHEKDNQMKRRHDGIQLLHTLSDALGPEYKPELVIYANDHDNNHETEFYNVLPRIKLEAEKYGWDVNRTLMVSDKFKAQ